MMTTCSARVADRSADVHVRLAARAGDSVTSAVGRRRALRRAPGVMTVLCLLAIAQNQSSAVQAEEARSSRNQHRSRTCSTHQSSGAALVVVRVGCGSYCDETSRSRPDGTCRTSRPAAPSATIDAGFDAGRMSCAPWQSAHAATRGSRARSPCRGTCGGTTRRLLAWHVPHSAVAPSRHASAVDALDRVRRVAVGAHRRVRCARSSAPRAWMPASYRSRMPSWHVPQVAGTLSLCTRLRLDLAAYVVRAVAVGARRRRREPGFLLGPGVHAVVVLRRDVLMTGGAADLREVFRVRKFLNGGQIGVAVDTGRRGMRRRRERFADIVVASEAVRIGRRLCRRCAWLRARRGRARHENEGCEWEREPDRHRCSPFAGGAPRSLLQRRVASLRPWPEQAHCHAGRAVNRAVQGDPPRRPRDISRQCRIFGARPRLLGDAPLWRRGECQRHVGCDG